MQNNFKKIRLLFLHSLSLSLFALGVPVHADNLLDIYRAAEKNDTQIRAASAEYQAQRQAIPQSRAALLPSISASINETTTTNETLRSDNPLFNVGKKEYDSSGWNVTLNQTIYNHAHYAALKQARANVSKAEADYDAARQTLIIRVAEAYFNILGALDSLEFAETEKKSVAEQLEQTRQRYEVGLIAITDVKESQASYDLAVAQEIQARNALDTRREELRVITNQDAETLKKLNENMLLTPPDPVGIEQWVNTALQQNLSLIASRFSLEAAHKEVSRLHAGHYPSLDLVARKNNNDEAGSTFSNGGSESETTNVSLQLSIPIFSGFGISSRVKQAVFREEAARENLESVERNVTRQTRNSYNTVIADISRVNALKQALISTQAAYEATNAGFEVGTRNSAEVLLALRDTFRAKRDHSQARYDYLLNSLRLKQAAGILNVQDVDALNHWLN